MRPTPSLMVLVALSVVLGAARLPAGTPSLTDTDGDGIGNATDNCLLVANPDQRDTNGNRYGNICDADFNGNGLVDSQDAALLKVAFGSAAFPDRDLNGNGIVDSQDGAILKGRFG